MDVIFQKTSNPISLNKAVLENKVSYDAECNKITVKRFILVT